MMEVSATWVRAALMAAVVSAAVSSLSVARAADDPSGSLYLRGGIGIDWSGDTRFTDENCMTETPVPLYGCGEGPDGAPFNSSGDFGTMVGFEVGAGLVVTPFLRIETAVLHHPSITFEGRTNFLESTLRQDVEADLSTLSAMASAYLDLSALGLPAPELPLLGRLSPFVGVGLGVSRIRIDETRMEFPETTTIVPGGSRTNHAWMLTAGVSAPVWDNVILDVSWRYMDFGRVATERGAGRVVWRDGSRVQPLPDVGASHADLSSHGLWTSVRYQF